MLTFYYSGIIETTVIDTGTVIETTVIDAGAVLLTIK